MRKIEFDMLDAIRKNKPFKRDNTQVKIDFNTAHVFLHDNHIASITYGLARGNIDTLRNYPTPTTKSRLRALGVDVYTKKGITYLYGEAING